MIVAPPSWHLNCPADPPAPLLQLTIEPKMVAAAWLRRLQSWTNTFPAFKKSFKPFHRAWWAKASFPTACLPKIRMFSDPWLNYFELPSWPRIVSAQCKELPRCRLANRWLLRWHNLLSAVGGGGGGGGGGWLLWISGSSSSEESWFKIPFGEGASSQILYCHQANKVFFSKKWIVMERLQL